MGRYFSSKTPRRSIDNPSGLQIQERTEQSSINTNTIDHVGLRDCSSCRDPCPSTLCGHQGRFRQMCKGEWRGSV
ncbi:hypothetical protein F2P79_003119 [Pimephales promelas]|nr:hypothetical protein F2P79_003119 [Pimephales promelas]